MKIKICSFKMIDANSHSFKLSWFCYLWAQTMSLGPSFLKVKENVSSLATTDLKLTLRKGLSM